MHWVNDLILPVVSYIVAFFIHRPKKPKAPSS
jgi:hypothetical protein